VKATLVEGGEAFGLSPYAGLDDEDVGAGKVLKL